MGAGVVASAKVHPELLGGDIPRRANESSDVRADPLAEFLGGNVLQLDMAAHREVGAVHLQRDPGRGDGLVFVAQAFGGDDNIFLVAGMILVG